MLLLHMQEMVFVDSHQGLLSSRGGGPDILAPGLQCIYYISGPENVTVALLSMKGQIALRFHQKYLNLCSEDERRSYGFRTT